MGPMLSSTMMKEDLNLWDFLEPAAELFGKKEVVSGLHTGEVHRTTYAEVHRRAKRLMGGLRALGAGVGDRVATLAFNHFRHLEAYFAVPGMGAVLHTANPRLSPKEIAYILNHAEDKVLLFDPQLLPLVEALRPELTTVAHFVVMDEKAPEGYLAYEAVLGEEAEPVRLPKEAACGMAYTTGTTGLPKGVVYSHRALVLHSLAASLPDATALSDKDAVLPVVHMFHVNAWCLPYAATLVGAKQVLPGPRLDPTSLVELFDGEEVTLTAGVPTVWLALADHLESTGHRLKSLKRLVVGGSAAPRSLVERFERMGIEVRQGYGLTETSPVVVNNFIKSYLEEGLSFEEKIAFKAKTGLPIPLVRLRVADEEGRPRAQRREDHGGGPAQRPLGHPGLLPERGSQLGRPDPGRLVPHRGHRRLGRGRVPGDQGPPQGPHQVRRGVDLQRGPGERPHGPPQGAGGSGGGHPPP